MVILERLAKSYGGKPVLEGVSVRLAPGSATALIGPNGSGKSTLIKSILGLTRPDSGSVTVGGSAVTSGPGYRSRIGYMPQRAQYPPNLRAREILTMLQGLREEMVYDLELLESFGLERDLDKPVRALSGGTRQKLNAVIAFMFRPEILILDEPTASLDPVAVCVLKDKLKAAKLAGRTILITSHVMSDIEDLADDLMYMAEGRLRFKARISDMKKETGEARLERALVNVLEER